MPEMATDHAAARDRFIALADYLIPAQRAMPMFSAVCGAEIIDVCLRFRPDVREAFWRGLAAVSATAPAEAALEHLAASDAPAFSAIGLVAVSAYYMAPEVRRLIGYPGQENVAYDARATPPYLLDGSLEQVKARGPRYIPTPA
jgi:hypothetical protein